MPNSHVPDPKDRTRSRGTVDNSCGRVHLEPTQPENKADLARVEAYFEQDDLPAEEIAWVQDRGLAVLRAEVLRLRAALARRAGSSL